MFTGSMGPDGVPPRVLKQLADITARSLTTIYQRSWESGKVRADWKLASVTPIHKKSMREDPGNYRPLSLTSAPGEIREKILLGTVERHLKNNAIVRHSQHGYTDTLSFTASFCASCTTVSGFTACWVKNWLKRRAQRVVVYVATSG